MPQTQTSWHMLYGALRSVLPPGCVHAGERLLHVDEQPGRVTATFDSGRVATGDLLVAADGARSTVRSQMLPDVHPSYAGYVAWRGLVPEPALDPWAAHVLGSAFIFQQGAGHLVLEYRVPGEDGSTADGRRRWNWVWYRPVARGAALDALLTDRDGVRHTQSLPPGLAQPGYVEALRRDATRLLAPSLRDLVLATEEPFVQTIVDLAVPRMRFGRTVLIGEAAFVPRPHTAGSAATAAAHALSLAKLPLEGGAGDAARLERWEADQLARGTAMTDWGRLLGSRLMRLTP
jgi:2-polyprenyl-6-methoxyphenol hydroxylase-like FAD-dependent oxidoreductase